MKGKTIILVILSILGIFSSCVTTRDTNFLQDISKEYPKIKEPEYKVIVGDRLDITVYSMDSEQLKEVLGPFADGGSLDVRADGTIKIPYLGKVYVEGLTLYEIGKLLSEKFSTLSDNTTATVRLGNMYYTLLGEMGTQRIAMIKPTMTIFEVMSKSSVPNLNGNRKKIAVLRQTKDGTVYKEFDIRTKDILDSEFYYIQPNDVIYVPRKNRDFWVGGNGTNLGAVIGIATGILGVVMLLVRLF